jgi:FkbM family methyltransferase
VTEPTLSQPSLQDRLVLGFKRLALSWHAMRNGQGRAVTLRHEGGLVRVHDGARQLFIPDVRSADRFRGGVAAQLEAAAAKYVGGTGYVPREGDVIVDVGAGIGEFSLWCADAGARIVAFEPDPLAYACLQRNIAGLAGAKAFPYALWKERANLRLHASRGCAESSLIEDGKASARRADVEAWPLDALPAIVALPVVDFMKVDGEGVEPEILAGGIRTLRRTRIIGVDVSATKKRPNLAARVETILESLNFRPLSHDRSDTLLALNTAMVGPFSNRAVGRRSS